MNIERKSFYSIKACQDIKNFAIKDVDTVGKTVTGFYNAYNFLDSYGDVLVPGACKRSIKERGPKSNASCKIKHALFHDLTRLPGSIKVLEERTVDGITGPYFEMECSDSTDGKDTLINYQEKIYDNHSIGYMYMDTQFVERDSKGWDALVKSLINPEAAEGRMWICKVNEVMLYEGSTVAIGANELSIFLGMKSGTPQERLAKLFERMDKLTRSVKSGTQSDEMLYLFDLQVKQIKQMISELEMAEPEERAPKPEKKKFNGLFSLEGANSLKL